MVESILHYPMVGTLYYVLPYVTCVAIIELFGLVVVNFRVTVIRIKTLQTKLCELSAHPRVLCHRVYVLSREPSTWLQSSFTRTVVRGLLAIVKT